MRCYYVYLLTALCAVILMGCEEQDCCLPEVPEGLVGTWLLVETGYSPGAGYIVEPVSPFPAQTITLDNGGRLSSNIREFEGITHYRIFNDPHQNGQVLGLFNTQPEIDVELDQAIRSYNISFESPGLKLYFRFCFEGCHLGFTGPEQ